MIVFFKVISDFGVSRLFKELFGQYSRCSRIASFCRRDLKKNWKYFNGSLLLKKFFENFLVEINQKINFGKWNFKKIQH